MPIGPVELARRTVREVIDDDCLGLAAQLSFYFLLALFPALLFAVALIGALPISGVIQTWLDNLAGIMRADAVAIVERELQRLSAGSHGSPLTFGIVGAVDVIYQVAPSARSEFTWLTPGAVAAVALWVAVSLAFGSTCSAWATSRRPTARSAV